jgi:hypothetical protein
MPAAGVQELLGRYVNGIEYWEADAGLLMRYRKPSREWVGYE